MRITVNKTIVTWKLGKELVLAGIAHNGMSLLGETLEILLVNDAQAPQAQTVVDAHTGVDTILQRWQGARATAQQIPNWATWTQQDWATWRDANVSATQINAIVTLVDARPILLKMAQVLDGLAKMELALRDQIFPELPEG